MCHGGELVLNEQPQRLADKIDTPFNPIELSIEPIKPNSVTLVDLRSRPTIEKCDQSINHDLRLR